MTKQKPTFQKANMANSASNRQPQTRSWVRLGMGLLLVGTDALTKRTKKWEKQDHLPTTLQTSQYQSPAEISNLQEELSTQSNYERQALIGMLFEAQNQLQKGMNGFQQVEKTTAHLLAPIFSPLQNNFILKPFLRTYEYLAARGQAEIERWQEIGSIEEEKSLQLVHAVTRSTVDDSITFLSTNPDVQELVQSQSTGLVYEIIEEIRERAVSINTVLEGSIRNILRLKPRSAIPPPPVAVCARANLFPSNT